MHPFEQIQNHVIAKLEHGLPSFLTYHNVAHTLDVLKQAVAIAAEEGIHNDEALLLLKTGALYHDTGFLYLYKNHEERGCAIAREELPSFHFNAEQIEKVCGLIMATKLPQTPQNFLEEIICDADLDYLGRPDFYTIGYELYKEFLHQGIVTDEKSWNKLQIEFLENHHYFTDTCKRKREPVKQKYLNELKAQLNPVG